MAAVSTIPDVCFLEDVARALRTSRSTVKRLRACGTFPIPELPSIDKRPRWSGKDVREFIDNQSVSTSRRLRRVG
jgi:hypothetical protein